MKELINKKLKAEKAFKIALIVSAILDIVISLFTSVLDFESDSAYPIIYLCSFVFLALLIAYFASFNQIRRSMANLKNIGATDVLDDVYPDTPTIPKSQIYCGKRALISKKPFCVLPYSDIAWIFVREKKMYGILTVSKTICIRTSTGKEFELNADPDEISWLLQNIILPRNPKVIVGFGPEHQKRYKQEYPVAAKNTYKKNFIAGCILLGLSLFFLFVGIFSGEIIALSVFVALLAVIGIVLIVMGSKYFKKN